MNIWTDYSGRNSLHFKYSRDLFLHTYFWITRRRRFPWMRGKGHTQKKVLLNTSENYISAFDCRNYGVLWMLAVSSRRIATKRNTAWKLFKPVANYLFDLLAPDIDGSRKLSRTTILFSKQRFSAPRPTLSHFCHLKIRGSTNFMKFEQVDWNPGKGRSGLNIKSWL